MAAIELRFICVPEGSYMATKIKGCLDEAKRFIRTLEVDTQNVESRSAYTFVKKEFGGLSLNPHEAKSFYQCVDKLYEAVSIDDIFDKKSIQNWFEIAILKSLELSKQSEMPLGQRIDHAVDELKSKLIAEPLEWQVHIPVEGLSVKGLPLSFGNVLFRAGNKKYKNKIHSQVDQVSKISPDTVESKKSFKNITLELVDENWIGKPIAGINVRAATSKAAQAKGLKELQATVDVLNFYTDILPTTGNGGRVYLPGDSSQGNAFSLASRFSDAGSCIGINLETYMVGPKSSFLLSKETTKQLRKFGFRHASNLLRKQERNEWDNRILSALQWAGRATSNRIINERLSEETGIRREESFLLYAVALESLLLKHGSEITYKFSTRGAHLIGEDLQARKLARNRLGELYSLRSKIVHSGSTMISKRDLDDMAMYSRTAVAYVLHDRNLRKFQKWSEFDEWLEDKMLR